MRLQRMLMVVAAVVTSMVIDAAVAFAGSQPATGVSPFVAEAIPPASPDGEVGVPPAPTIGEIDLSAGYFAPAPESASLEPQALSPVIEAGGCFYRQGVDNPHVTRGEASAHAWWVRVRGGCPDTATSTVYLQAWWCQGPLGCFWVTVDSGSRSEKPGTGKRANAREACASTREVGWRAAGDVDLDWHLDPAGLTYSEPQNLECMPSTFYSEGGL